MNWKLIEDFNHALNSDYKDRRILVRPYHDVNRIFGFSLQYFDSSYKTCLKLAMITRNDPEWGCVYATWLEYFADDIVRMDKTPNQIKYYYPQSFKDILKQIKDNC